VSASADRSVRVHGLKPPPSGEATDMSLGVLPVLPCSNAKLQREALRLSAALLSFWPCTAGTQPPPSGEARDMSLDLLLCCNAEVAT
jgi:hypothetical protein